MHVKYGEGMASLTPLGPRARDVCGACAKANVELCLSLARDGDDLGMLQAHSAKSRSQWLLALLLPTAYRRKVCVCCAWHRPAFKRALIPQYSPRDTTACNF